MNADRRNFSEQLLQCETPDENLRQKYEKEIQAMFEKQLGPAGRALWWFWTVFCAAQAILFVVIGVWSYGKLPIWGTIGFAAGVVFAVFKAVRQKDHLQRWLLTCFLLWVVLFCGRRSLGALADLLPLSSGLHMHRFVVAVQLFGLLLAANALDVVLKWLRPPSWPRWLAGWPWPC